MFDNWFYKRRLRKQLRDIETFERPESYMENSLLRTRQRNRIKRLKVHGRLLINHTNADMFNKDALLPAMEQAKKEIVADANEKHSRNVLLIRDLVAHRESQRKELEAMIVSITEEIEKIDQIIASLEEERSHKHEKKS